MLSPTVNESYTLSVPADGSPATLVAATQWGALRGLESFLQLVVWRGPDLPTAYEVTAAPLVVTDSPRFTHRGVLIDTSFNFLTVSRIKEVLDSMPVLKSNILHWHMLDDPAWPMASSTYPAFTAPGSGGPYASVATYSVAEQAEIAAYAWERGVMILLEFDVPGHCASWGAGSPTLVTACEGHQTLINPVGEVGTGFYAYLEGLMREFYTRVGSPGLPLIHLGGDEVTDYTCWLNSTDVQDWARAVGADPKDPTSIRRAFTSRVQAVAQAVGLRAAFWEESFLGGFGLNTSAIVTPWVHPDTASKAAAVGHDVINYIGGYLDQWVSPARTDTQWYSANVSYGYIESWRLLYTYPDLGGMEPTSTAAGRILGGFASAWGDNVDSSLGAAGLLFPRALAVGERLWSAAEATLVTGGAQDPALDAVAERLEWARCRLVQRGVGASPVGIAGTYGFCWSPRWEKDGGGGGSSSNGTAASPGVSGVALAASLFGATALGAAMAVLWLSRGKEAASTATAAASTPQAQASNSAESSSEHRMVALDQFRGLTMMAMLFVNLYYGRSGLPAIFSHGITYMSGPDLVEPAFHFCVGFALRLVALKRLGKAVDAGNPAFWSARLALFRRLLQTRVIGLIVLSMFFSEGWGQFDSWVQIQRLGFWGWLLALVQNVQPYHTLLHIALITVWTILPMTLPAKFRVLQLIATACLHTILLSTFYFRWIADYGLDEGGYFGFLGWSVTALTGSLCHDVIMWARRPGGGSGRMQTGASRPLLLNNSDEEELDSADRETATTQDTDGSSRVPQALRIMFASSLGLMLLAYLLSCLGVVPALNPICYDGTRIYFWGGFGPPKDCALVPKYLGGWAVAPPFFVPAVDTNVVTQWTMTQRAGSLTYHLFTAGTSLLLFTVFFVLCEVGVGPLWSVRSSTLDTVAGFVGLTFSPVGGAAGEGKGRWAVRWTAADLYGGNSLAVYLFSDPLANNISNMLPSDVPAWYFLLWGEGLYFLIAYFTTAYLRHNKLFLRL